MTRFSFLIAAIIQFFASSSVAQTADYTMLAYIGPTDFTTDDGRPLSLCIEEPPFGIGDPWYVIALDNCLDERYYEYLDDAYFLQAQQEGTIDPSLPLPAVLPDNGRTRLDIFWDDVKYNLGITNHQVDIEDGVATGTSDVMSNLIKLVGALAGLVFGAIKAWEKVKGIFSGSAPNAGSSPRKAKKVKPLSKTTASGVELIAHMAMINGHFNQCAVPVIGHHFEEITGRRFTSADLSAMFATPVTTKELQALNSKLNSKEADMLINAAYDVAVADGEITARESQLLEALCIVHKRPPLNLPDIAA